MLRNMLLATLNVLDHITWVIPTMTSAVILVILLVLLPNILPLMRIRSKLSHFLLLLTFLRKILLLRWERFLTLNLLELLIILHHMLRFWIMVILQIRKSTAYASTGTVKVHRLLVLLSFTLHRRLLLCKIWFFVFNFASLLTLTLRSSFFLVKVLRCIFRILGRVLLWCVKDIGFMLFWRCVLMLIMLGNCTFMVTLIILLLRLCFLLQVLPLLLHQCMVWTELATTYRHLLLLRHWLRTRLLLLLDNLLVYHILLLPIWTVEVALLQWWIVVLHGLLLKMSLLNLCHSSGVWV